VKVSARKLIHDLARRRRSFDVPSFQPDGG
jgi:hypothetical protein